MTRSEHLDWCKARAIALVERGQLHEAFASMASDLGKHPETRGHTAIHLGGLLLFGGHLDSQVKMRDFIEGFS
jgi:hypothetical protein